MNKHEFLSDKNIKEFSGWLIELLNSENFEHRWLSFSTLSGVKRGLYWECNSIFNAYDKYYWKSTCPSSGKEVTSFPETEVILIDLSKRLKYCLSNKELTSDSLASVCKDILIWGGVYDKPHVAAKVKKLDDISLLAYLKKVKSILNDSALNSDFMTDVDKGNLIEIDSGTTKIYSLMLDNFAIYDSRVGCALGLLVNKFVKEKKYQTVPDLLRFSWGGDKIRRNPNQLNSKIFPEFNNKKFPDIRMKHNIEASWLIEYVGLNVNQSSGFFKLNVASRLRAIEAALFMIGYGVGDENRIEELFNKPKKSSSKKTKESKVPSDNKIDKTKVGRVKEKKTTNHDKLLSHVQFSQTSLSKAFGYTNLIQLAQAVIPEVTPSGQSYASLRFIQKHSSIIKGDVHAFNHFKELSDPRKFSSLVELKNDWQFKLD